MSTIFQRFLAIPFIIILIMFILIIGSIEMVLIPVYFIFKGEYFHVTKIVFDVCRTVYQLSDDED